MSKARKEGAGSISKGRSVEQIGEFWDTHSLADHWDQTRDASFTVRATCRRRVTIDPEAYGQLEALARQRGISPETLVNLWVAEQLRTGRKARQAAPRRPRSRAKG